MAKNGDTQTTTETNTPPEWLQKIQQSVAGTAGGMAAPFTLNPAFGLAGQNVDQQAVQNGWRDLYINNQNNHGLQGQAATTLAGPAALANAAQVDAGDVTRNLNPWNQAVVDATMRNMNRNHAQELAEIGARSAAAQPFGGSGEALMRAQSNRDFQDKSNSMVAQLMQQGYSQAQAIAQANTQMRQQAEMANASAANQVNLQNAQFANSTANNNASRAMQGENDWWTHMLQSMQGLQSSGDRQQQFAQQGIDLPWTMLQKYASLVPGYSDPGGTKTRVSPDNSPDPIMQLLGMATTLGASYLKSDENTKANIDRLGKDPKTGLEMIAYDDRADLQRAKEEGTPMPPKRVSVIAQDVEKVDPKAVRKVGRTKVVSTQSLYDMIKKGAA